MDLCYNCICMQTVIERRKKNSKPPTKSLQENCVEWGGAGRILNVYCTTIPFHTNDLSLKISKGYSNLPSTSFESVVH